MKRLSIRRVTYYFLIPLIISIMCILLFTETLQSIIKREIPNSNHQMIFLFIILFTFVYIIHRLVTMDMKKYYKDKYHKQNGS